MNSKANGIVILIASILFAALLLLYSHSVRKPALRVRMIADANVSLEVNSRGQVIRANAGNEKGRMILATRDLERLDIHVAMDVLVKALAQHGHLEACDGQVYLSVDGTDRNTVETNRILLQVGIESIIEDLLEEDPELKKAVTSFEVTAL